MDWLRGAADLNPSGLVPHPLSHAGITALSDRLRQNTVTVFFLALLIVEVKLPSQIVKIQFKVFNSKVLVAASAQVVQTCFSTHIHSSL